MDCMGHFKMLIEIKSMVYQVELVGKRGALSTLDWSVHVKMKKVV